jgi:hypothetical protein
MTRSFLRASAAVLASFILMPAAASAQAGALPPAEQLVTRYVQAIGGADAYKKNRSMKLEARFEIPAQGMQGSVVTMQMQPNKSVTRVTLPGMGEIVSGFDGNVAWSMNPFQGSRVLDGAELQQAKDQAQWGAMIRDRELISEMETVERTTMGGTACYKVRIAWKSGMKTHDCYAVEGGLLVANLTEQTSAMGTAQVETIYSEYKAFDGIRLPTRMVQQAMGMEQRIMIDNVEFNTLSAADFEAPAEIKALTGAGN